MYVAPCGRLGDPYKVEKIYIPKEYQNIGKKRNRLFDYALLKLATKTSLDDFIPLGCDFLDKLRTKMIGIYGYSLSSYKRNKYE